MATQSRQTRIVAVTSLMVILIFVVIIAFGITQEYNGHASLTPQQELTVKNTVAALLTYNKDDIKNYDVEVRSFSFDHRRGAIAELKSNTTQQIYVIDLNTSQVLLHQRTDISPWGAQFADKLCERFNADLCRH